MPRKKSPAGKKRVSLVSEAEVQEAMDDMLALMKATILARPGMTKKKYEKRQRKTAREWNRFWAKGEAKWDAASPEWRAARTAEINADQIRHYGAPADDPRGLWVVGYAVAQEKKAYEKKHPPVKPPTWEERMAEINARRAARDDREGATATDAAPAPDEPEEKAKGRRRPRAGLAGYVDPRLFDNDNDDEWN